jgi:beta-lactamase class A
MGLIGGVFASTSTLLAQLARTLGVRVRRSTRVRSPRGLDEPETAARLRDGAALIVGLLNGERLDEDRYTEAFIPELRARVPYTQLAASTAALVERGPFELVDEAFPIEHGLIARIEGADGTQLELRLEVASANSVTITKLELQPWLAAPIPIDEAVALLTERGDCSYLQADVTDGTCRPLGSLHPDRQVPIGSVSKLYVLAALIDAVDDGSARWDDEIALRVELASLPSGTTQDEHPGTLLSVRDLASRMVGTSDNTATDHLTALIGRESVEAALARWGHSDPAVNRPWLTTRELFVLKWGVRRAAQRAFIEAPPAERRRILETDIAVATLPKVNRAVGRAVALDAIEWFASPADLCRLLIRVAEDPVARDLLALNCGVPPPDDRWTYVGFKGGGEPGLLAVAWLVETRTGQRFTLTGALTSDMSVDNIEIGRLFASMRDGIATRPAD